MGGGFCGDFGCDDGDAAAEFDGLDMIAAVGGAAMCACRYED